jgi:hypothetical protein
MIVNAQFWWIRFFSNFMIILVENSILSIEILSSLPNSQ